MGNNITNKRIDELDYIRGFALLGIILVNILALLNIKTPYPNTVDASYRVFILICRRSFLLNLLILIWRDSISLFQERLRKGRMAMFYFTSLSSIIYFGLIHQMFQPGEALALYAICGLIVLPFYKAKKK